MPSQSGKITWLHISDFHFKAGESYDRDVVLRALKNSLPTLISRTSQPNFVIASGDVAFSGRKAEYVPATLFFDDILKACGLPRERLIVVPGNHDVDRNGGRGLVRTLQNNLEADEYFRPGDYLTHAHYRQAAFKEWYDCYFEGIIRFDNRTTCGEVIEFDINNLKVRILGINSALFCVDDNDSGKLWVGRRSLDGISNKLSKDNNSLSFIVMHHPLSWLHHDEVANVKVLLRESSDCILSGHLHSNDVEQVAGIYSEAIHLAAGASYQTRKWPNTASICSFEKGNITVTPIRYEDSPIEVWTLDTSLFPMENNYSKTYSIKRFGEFDRNTKEESDISVDINQPSELIFDQNTSYDDGNSLSKSEFEENLLATSHGDILYAEPRIVDKQQKFTAGDSDEAGREIPLSKIILSKANYVIHTRPEYGGTTLCKKLFMEISSAGIPVYLRNARTLPNYRRKIEKEFPTSIQTPAKSATLILDHFDAERDERLIKELIATKWFSRFIIIVVDRSALQTNVVNLDVADFVFERVYLWSVSRSQLRLLAHKILRSDEDRFISRAVDKVYQDLLSLCIPVTPANAIMYLRILDREGEYHPLNRVDIVGRYLQELLRANSNVSVDAFNAKSKSDFLSELCYKMFTESLAYIDDRYWFNFCKDYQTKTLLDFDESALFHELMEARVLVRAGKNVFFKYQYFFAYFLGRSIAFRSDRLNLFLEAEDYLTVAGVLDVITGLSTDNTSVMRDLTSKLNSKLDMFAEEYIDKQYDPLSKAIWPDNTQEEEKLWKPLTQEIDAGPKSTTEIDIVKTSVFAESLTADQTVRYNRFREMEHSLFVTAKALTDTIRNADDVEGRLKLAAYEGVLQSHFVALQIGTVFSEELSRRRFFQWGGVLFLDFNSSHPSDEPIPFSTRFNVIHSLFHSVCSKASEELGTYKLAGVCRSRTSAMTELRSYELMNFAVTLSTKGPRWAESLTEFVNKTDKNSYYLSFMIDRLMHDLGIEILSTKDRDSIKKLVALIHTKRSLGKQAPGSKAVNNMLRRLEDEKEFNRPAE